MTHSIKAALGAAAVLMLAACSATHVGEAWQCPLAQAPGCVTVAGADPAVAEAVRETEPELGAPLYGRRGAGAAGPTVRNEEGCERGCTRGFDPLAWLGGLFRTVAGDAQAPSPVQRGPGEAGAAPAVHGVAASPGTALSSATPEARAGAVTAALPVPAERPVESPAAGAEDRGVSAPPATAPLPARPVAGEAALREPEVLGRIWIAPFVDADGHYREGAYVRTVLEPAGWRVP